VVVPMILLRRAQPGRSIHKARKLGSAPPPPIRRNLLQQESNGSFSRLEGSLKSSRSGGNKPIATETPDVQALSSDVQSSQSDPLYALKAFGIATCAVAATAAAGVWAVRWLMDVRTVWFNGYYQMV
jgi:hypothetical protein